MERLALFNQTNVDLNYVMSKTTFHILLFSRVLEIKIFSPLLVSSVLFTHIFLNLIRWGMVPRCLKCKFYLLKCLVKDSLYIFSWKYLRIYLHQDCQQEIPSHVKFLSPLNFSRFHYKKCLKIVQTISVFISNTDKIGNIEYNKTLFYRKKKHNVGG